MSSFVKKIADRNYPGGLAYEVRRQGRGAPSKGSYQRIQFPAPIGQIHVGDSEIAGAENGDGREQEPVLSIQEPVLAGRFRQE